MTATKFRRSTLGFLKVLPLLVYGVTVLGVLYFLVVTSVKSQNEYMLNKTVFPEAFIIANFAEVLSQSLFVRWLLNSVIVTAISLATGSLVSVLLSFGLSRYHFRFRNETFALVASLMVVPPIVLIIPLYQIATDVKMVNTYWGTMLMYAAWIVPFWTYFLTKFFSTVSKPIIDSAEIDGCSDFRILWNMIIPLSKAPLITLTTVSTLWVWNDLLISLIFMQRDSLKTLMVGLTMFKGLYSVNVPATFAGLIVATVPMMAFYIFAQRFFMKGVLSGAIKG